MNTPRNSLDSLFAAARTHTPPDAPHYASDEVFAHTLRNRITGDRMARTENRTLARGLAIMALFTLASMAWTQNNHPPAPDAATFIVPESALDYVFLAASTTPGSAQFSKPLNP